MSGKKSSAPDWRDIRIRGSTIGAGHEERFNYLLKSGLFSDVEFIVGEKKEVFQAHKLILRTGSKVFDKLFNMEPAKTSFEVPDLEPEAFQILLKVSPKCRVIIGLIL